MDQSQTEYNVPSLPRDLYTIYILKKISKELPGIATNDSYMILIRMPKYI